MKPFADLAAPEGHDNSAARSEKKPRAVVLPHRLNRKKTQENQGVFALH
jgi:hypothetical protein